MNNFPKPVAQKPLYMMPKPILQNPILQKPLVYQQVYQDKVVDQPAPGTFLTDSFPQKLVYEPELVKRRT